MPAEKKPTNRSKTNKLDIYRNHHVWIQQKVEEYLIPSAPG